MNATECACRQAERDNLLAEALLALSCLDLCCNTVAFCYDRRPENFAVAMRDMAAEAERARAVLAKARSQQPKEQQQ